jgi:GNAT superfamily N-acetyltransferase
MSLPVRVLAATDAARIEHHLLRLTAADRSLRFAGGIVTDEAIRRHVAAIRFGTDAVLAMRDDADRVVAFAHGSVHAAGGWTRVEVAVSVDAERRGHGLGSTLMAEACRFAGSIGAYSVLGVCLARDVPMRRLFARVGMAMTLDGDRVHACRQLAVRRRQASPGLVLGSVGIG